MIDRREHEMVTAADLAAVRHQVIEAADRAGLPLDVVTRFTLAVNEVVTNAVVHGGGFASVTVTGDRQRVVVEVRDHGNGIPEGVTTDLPPPEQTHGRGLWLARQLCDDLTIHSDGGGTLVRLSTSLPVA